MHGKDYINIAYKRLETIKITPDKEIYLVMEQATRCLYILKIVNRENLPDKKLLGVQHPNLASIQHLTEDDGKTYIIMEYIAGLTLTEYLPQNPQLNFEALKNIITALCSALSCLHSHGIIHRDIKPDNIFINNDGVVKLLDYDAAREKTAPKEQDTICLGTQGYASPEQYGFQSTDERSDIYSLGVTMKFILGNQYTSAMKAIIDKCTQFDPQNRYQSVDEIQLELNRPTSISNMTFQWKAAYIIHEMLLFCFVNIFIWGLISHSLPHNVYVAGRYENMVTLFFIALGYCYFITKHNSYKLMIKENPKFSGLKKSILFICYWFAWQLALGFLGTVLGLNVTQGYWDELLLSSTMVLSPALALLSVTVKNNLKVQPKN